MSTIKAIRSSLLRARRLQCAVRIRVRFDTETTYGYVVAVGPKFFAVATVEDCARFNGFKCFRVSDVRKLQVPEESAGFMEAALRKRRVRRPKWPKIDVSTVGTLLTTANRFFPLVTTHEQIAFPDCCDIGRVISCDKTHVSLLRITPKAVWCQEPTRIRLSKITRVDFGGDYEGSLHLVGGAAPVAGRGR